MSLAEATLRRPVDGGLVGVSGRIALSSQDKPDVFLCLEELLMDDMQRLPSGSCNVAIEVSNGCFSWDGSPEIPTLKDLDF